MDRYELMRKIAKSFKIGDKVKLYGCPYDEQIPEGLQKYIKLKDKIQTITNIRQSSSFTGIWIKTDMEQEWIDIYWYVKINESPSQVD